MSDQQTVSADTGSLQRAIQQEPLRADLRIHLGDRLHQAGNLEGAVQCYRDALALDPQSCAAYNNLGDIFASLRDWNTALIFLHAALALDPGMAEIHNNLGNIFLAQGQTHAAIDSFRKALALQPETASFHNHLGDALRAEQRYPEAETAIRKALSLRPEYAEAFVNLGFLFFEQGQLASAEECYRQAVALKPDLAQAHTCLGWMLLRKGDFAAGWPETEWRWRWKGFPSPKRTFPQPQWNGEDPAGLRIFLHAEQGFGDTIQFLRYVPLLAARGASIVLEVHPELTRLAQSTSGVDHLISRGDPVPPFDQHCPLMSLPLAFSTTLETIPADIPYLHAALGTPAHLLKDADGADRKLRVGIVWAGDPKSPIDRRRSLSVSEFAPLRELKHLSFFSLQRGPSSRDEGINLFPFAGTLALKGDFAETAAAISHLDLILSVDTAVAHLAGALGLPVWILLPRVADWRWLLDREDSPWYPTARLFRQETAAEWEPVIRKVVAELSRKRLRPTADPG